MTFFRERSIAPGWRYTVAQTVLRLLFGRKHHYLSPWCNAGVGAAVIILNPEGDKVLLQQRAGKVENAGKWGTFGGFLNLEDTEDFPTGLTREFFEETGVRLNPKSFAQPDYVNILHKHPMHMHWQYSWVAAWYFRAMPEDFIESLSPSDEVSAYKWVAEAEFQTMWRKGEISGIKENHYGSTMRAFQKAAAGPLPPLLLAVQ